MSQSTLAIPNQSGANYRVAVNNALQALASLYSGTTPSESYAYQLWFDTSTNILKQRNAANNAWVNLWGVSLSSPVVIDFRDTRLEVHGSGNVNSNTAVGQNSLFSNTTGTSNTAVGQNSLFSNTIGTSNTAVGVSSLSSNTIGINNTAVGVSSLSSNTTGINNTAVGLSSLTSNTIGTDNTAVGQNSLFSNTTGTNNTAVGFQAGHVGFQVTNQSNNVILGNSSVTTLRCQVTTITAFSDQRDKTNIADLPFVATDFLSLLRPRKFEWNLRPQLGVRVGNPEIGFIAQEVEEALDAAGVNIPNLLDTSINYHKDPESGETTETEVKSLGQGTLLPVIVKAIQELNERLNALEA